VTSWNVGGERIKGYSANEILGQHFSRFYTEADRANGKPSRALQVAREQGRYEEEGWRVRKNGSFFWASVVIDPIHEGDRLIGFAKITRCRSIWPKHRSSTRSVNSPAAWRTTSTTS
jgi:PAS domain S-box-containing protein